MPQPFNFSCCTLPEMESSCNFQSEPLCFSCCTRLVGRQPPLHPRPVLLPNCLLRSASAAGRGVPPHREPRRQVHQLPGGGLPLLLWQEQRLLGFGLARDRVLCPLPPTHAVARGGLALPLWSSTRRSRWCTGGTRGCTSSSAWTPPTTSCCTWRPSTCSWRWGSVQRAAVLLLLLVLPLPAAAALPPLLFVSVTLCQGCRQTSARCRRRCGAACELACMR